MWILLSHVAAFLTLTAAGISDLKTTEVPDSISIIGVVAGLLFHGVASYTTGSLEPLMWSVGIGLAFSLYGWGMYFAGMWGGADAFGMSVLGFAAPYAISGFSIIYPMNLFINMMIVGFLYTIGFAFYRALKSENFVDNLKERLGADKERMVAEVSAAAAISVIIHFHTPLNSVAYFTGIAVIIVLYRFLKVLEETEMVREIPVSDVQEGDVVEADGIDGLVKGITQDEIDSLEVETVKVKEGVRFVPVFPVALLITDLFGLGILFLTGLISL